jgi:2,3-bisphosphoglycerate-independent phosphoglycerate mutase
MTANLDTDLEAKFKAAEEALRLDDLVILHLKGADIAAHDQRPDLKALFLEQLDRQLARLLEEHEGPLRVAVASDHATLSESGQHAADPLPVLIWGEGIEADGVEVFDEQSAGGGRLQRFPLQMLLGRLFKLN